MLVVNSAPVDQSGRTLMLSAHLAQTHTKVTLLTYQGMRQVEKLDRRIACIYMRNIQTSEKSFLLRSFLLPIKLAYISIVSVYFVVQEYREFWRAKRSHPNNHLESYPNDNSNDNPNDNPNNHSSNHPNDNPNNHSNNHSSNHSNDHSNNHSTIRIKGAEKPSVLFVAPPILTIVLPVVIGKMLGMRVLVDWHRVSYQTFRLVQRYLAMCVENTVVTKEMKRYFKKYSVKKVHLITDISLSVQAKKTDCSKIDRAVLFSYLSKKYPEYKNDFEKIDVKKKIGICSTSCSKEEDIEEFLKIALESREEGTLLFTTKKKIIVHHPTLKIVQVFLDYEDYVRLLQAADFGISTHVCQYDFPLKIVDYARYNLPVIAHFSTPNIPPPLSVTLHKFASASSLLKILSTMYKEAEE